MSSIRKGLYIVSTPIGNLEDITLRAIHILNNSDIILCEDTRHSVKLLNHYKIKKKLISHHKFNEKKSIPKIIKYLNEGKILSIISDAGTPVLSDPGNYLVKECIKNDINIFPIPGPSAITSAAAVSGFDTKFLFYGKIYFIFGIKECILVYNMFLYSRNRLLFLRMSIEHILFISSGKIII